MNLLENEQKGFNNSNFLPGASLFDDIGETKLIEDLVGYIPTEEKEVIEEFENNGLRSQKPNPPSDYNLLIK